MQVIELPTKFLEKVKSVESELSASYDAAYLIKSERQRSLAQALAAQIGTVDWQVEGYSSPERQRDLSIKFHWGHDHRFDESFFLPGRMANRHLALIAEFLTGFDISRNHFEGKNILDVGCWTGGTTLTLKMLGAHRIHALEEVRKYADAANNLCRDIYGFNDIQCEPTSLFRYEKGTYDCVYVPGVVYHLSDPVLGLRRLYNRLNDGGDIFVESQGLDDPKPICRFDNNGPGFGQNSTNLDRGGWNWFSPSASCLGAWMECAGFEDVRVFRAPSGRVYGYGRRNSFVEITRAGLSVPDIE